MVGRAANEGIGGEGDDGSRVSALATFFGPRQSAYATQLKCRDHYFALCTRSPLRLADECRAETVTEDLRKAIRQAMSRDGGIIVEIHASRSLLTVAPVDAKGYKAPQKMLKLSANETASIVAIGSKISYQAGDHYLIPSDESAQEKLKRLKDALEFLPQDQERSVLNLIREPRLELRLQVLEWAAAAAAGDPGSTRRPPTRAENSGFLPLLRQAFGLPAGLGWLVVCTLLLGGLFLYRTAPEPVDQANPRPDNSEKVDVKGIERAAKALLLAMSDSKRPPVEHLYNTHGLSRADADPLKNAAFAEAALKLEFLRLQMLPDNSPDLEGTNKREDILKITDPKKHLGDSGVQVNALAYLGCQVSGDSHPKIAEIDIPGSCTALGDAQTRRIKLGFDELTKWVSTKPDKAAAPNAQHK